MTDENIFYVHVTAPDGHFSTGFDSLNRAASFAALCAEHRKDYLLSGQNVTITFSASQKD